MSRTKNIANGIHKLLSKFWQNPGFIIVVSLPPKYDRITWFGNMDSHEKRVLMLKAALEFMEEDEAERKLKNISEDKGQGPIEAPSSVQKPNHLKAVKK